MYTGIEVSKFEKTQCIKCFIIQNNQIRQFLLSSLVRSNRGQYDWKINLPVLEKSLDRDFPHTNNSDHGKTLFIGGEQSNYIR